MDYTKTINFNLNEPKIVEQEYCDICGGILDPVEFDSCMLRCSSCGMTKEIALSELQVGSEIGNKYRLLNAIGAGGAGNIFLCHPIGNVQERYVIKVLRDHNTELNRRRFCREAQLLMSIKSEQIVKIIDYWFDKLGNFIVLEYIDGDDLKTLRKTMEFDEEATLIIGKEIAKNMAEIWNRHKIIHRDIKPANIMLDRNGQIKLLDFGISKKMDDFGTNITLEHRGLGTPGFMSPEQFKNFKDVTFKSDMFSLGATMFFLLTGKPPFNGKLMVDIYNDTLLNSPPSIKEDYPKISKGMEALLRKMMQVDPNDRPVCWEDIVETTRMLLKSIPKEEI